MPTNNILAGRVSVLTDTTVGTEVVSVITTTTPNCGMVIAPTGVGAIMANIPDGTPTGGNARGDYAVDLQMQRQANTQVASGELSVIGGGRRNTAIGLLSSVLGGSLNGAIGNYSTVCGGEGNSVSAANGAVVGGLNNTINSGAGYSSILGGYVNTISPAGGYASVLGGRGTFAYLHGMVAFSSGGFGNESNSNNQTSNIRLFREIQGTSQTELFLNFAANARAVLSNGGNTVNARAWRVQVDLIAIVQTAGAGGLVLGETYVGTYFLGIKRIGSTTSLIGSGVTAAFEEWDTNMATAAVVITADDGNDSLKIEFKPSNLADANTVTRVIATAYLTEVGY